MLVLNGSTHGDEYEGPTLLREWSRHWRPSRLKGTVVMIPVLNEAAFYAGQRCTPEDGGNLARAFPGRAQGAPTARLAHLFDTQILAQGTHYVDLHSAGAAYELQPWVGYMIQRGATNAVQKQMAACFDAFWCWAGPFLPGRTLSAAHSRGIPAIYLECRGAGGIAAEDHRNLDRGLRQLLVRLGLVAGKPGRLRKQAQRITRNASEAHLQVHHPAPCDGLFEPDQILGRSVRRGTVLGTVTPLTPGEARFIRAEHDGRIVMLRRQRSVRRGDALCTLVPL